MSVPELLGVAADYVNQNEEAHEAFKRARAMDDQEFRYSFDRPRLLLELYYTMTRTNPVSNVGYWYGRYTDPRWDKK